MINLMLGDCIDVMKTLPDGCVDCIATDPPYGIDYRTPNGAQASAKHQSTTTVEWGPIAGDDKPNGEWLTEAYRVMRLGAAIYLCTRWDVEPEWRRLLAAAGFLVKQRLTWHKRAHGKGDLKGTYATTCEDVLFASKGRHRLNRRPSMLLDAGCVPTWEHRFHPHQKPVLLMRGLIETSTQPGDVVLDPFMGSGSTGLACLETGRSFIGIDSHPPYFADAQRRIAEASPETTTGEASQGLLFDVLTA